MIFLDATGIDAPREAIHLRRVDRRFGHVQPGIRPLGPDLNLTHCCQVLVELVAILGAELPIHFASVREHRVENAAAPRQLTTLHILAFFLDSEETIEDVPDVAFGGDLNAVPRPRQRVPLDCQFE